MASWSFPLSPVDPPTGVGAIHGYQHRPLVYFIISPYRVNGVSTKGLSENQAAWIGLIGRITLNDLSLKYRKIDLIKCEIICLGFLIGMITYSDPTGTNCVYYAIDVHVSLSYTGYLYCPNGAPDQRARFFSPSVSRRRLGFLNYSKCKDRRIHRSLEYFFSGPDRDTSATRQVFLCHYRISEPS